MYFYPKLALSNMSKNKKLYFSYILTSIFSIMMFYVIDSLVYNQGLQSHATTHSFLSIGSIVVALIALFILLYANSFVIKSRKKEFALYSILGMEKKHIMLMMFFETLYLMVGCIISGIVFGIVFSQVMYLILLHILHITIDFSFSIPMKAISHTFMIFIAIYIITFIYNLLVISISKPVELIKGNQVGEREPKAKTLTTIIGIISLGIGYYMACSIKNPISATGFFFIAVLFVIIGTYCLFMAGSVTLLKLLKKNKHYYYQTRHFISLSSMIYRMKQNAVGLANICILCTCVLVTISSTSSLYFGIEKMAENRCVADQFIGSDDKDGQRLYGIAKKMLIRNHLDIQDYFQLQAYTTVILKTGTHQYSTHTEDSKYQNYVDLTIIDIDQYNKVFDKNITLKNNEVLVNTDLSMENDYTIGKDKFYVKKILNDDRLKSIHHDGYHYLTMIVGNNDFISNYQSDGEILDKWYYIGFNYNQKDDVLRKKTLKMILDEYSDRECSYSDMNRYELLEDSYEIYGGLLFIGILISATFLLAAILIIYNKQLSEGFEDQKRFEILQNVGLSQKEVKGAVKSQVLLFFFMPLVVAIVHLIFAYPLINVVMRMFMMGNISYLKYCITCVLCLVIIYSVVYLLTARTYYSIVKR